MAVWGEIRGIIGGSASVIMIIVLTVADYLWGENVFNCPCGGYRILYTSAFLIVPPVVIILIDVSWKDLFSTCRQCCGDLLACETVVRLTARPVIIAVIWLMFSFMEPKFSTCLFRDVPCNCTEAELQNNCSIRSKEQEATIRVGAAAAMLFLTAVFAICRILICWYYASIRTSCYSQMQVETDDVRTGRKLMKILSILGLESQTVIKLLEDNLMHERLLMNMSEDALRGIGNSISIEQLEILREHRRDIRLVRWLLEQNYAQDKVRQILDKAKDIGQTLVTVRDSLNSTGTVPDDAATNLRGELINNFNINRNNPEQEGNGRNTSELQVVSTS